MAKQAGQDGHGPFPFAYGYAMAINAALAARVAASQFVRKLVNDSFLDVARHRRSKKCTPSGDAALGWAIATLAPPPNITLFDLSYHNRFQHFRGAASQRELRLRTAVLHTATSWNEHFRWALCTSTPQPIVDLRLAPPEKMPIMGCRGAVTLQNRTPRLQCGVLGCRGSQPLVHADSPCARDAACSQYYNDTFTSWAFCIRVRGRPVDRQARIHNASACRVNESEVLQQCAAPSGFGEPFIEAKP